MWWPSAPGYGLGLFEGFFCEFWLPGTPRVILTFVLVPSGGDAMALAQCRECGKEISTEAVSCPHCGVPSPTSASAPPSPGAAGSPFRKAAPPPQAKLTYDPRTDTFFGTMALMVRLV